MKKRLVLLMLALLFLRIFPTMVEATVLGADAMGIVTNVRQAAKPSVTDGIAWYSVFYKEGAYWIDPPETLKIQFPDKHSAREITNEFAGFPFAYFEWEECVAKGTIISVAKLPEGVGIKYSVLKETRNITIPFGESVTVYIPIQLKLAKDCTYFAAPYTDSVNETGRYAQISAEDFFAYFEYWDDSDGGNGGRASSGEVNLYIKNNTICSMCIPYYA